MIYDILRTSSFVDRCFQAKTEFFGEIPATLSSTNPAYNELEPVPALRSDSSGINRMSRPDPFEGHLYVNVTLPYVIFSMSLSLRPS